MIRRERPVACRELRAAEVGELFCMELHRKTQIPGRIENTRDL